MDAREGNGCRRLKGASSDLHAEDSDNADVGGLAELYGDETVGLGVPEGGGGRCDGRAIVLLDDARDHVLELLVQLR